MSKPQSKKTRKGQKEKAKERPPEEHWQKLVSCFFRVTAELKHDVPTFDGAQPRDLRMIVEALKKRAKHQGVEWTEQVAVHRLETFLHWANKDYFLSHHWVLHFLNRSKDVVFFMIAEAYKK